AIFSTVIYAHKLRTVADGPVHRDGLHAQHLADLVQQIERIAGGTIHLVDESKDGNATLATNLKEFQGLWLNTFRTIDDHHGTVYSRESAVRVFREMLMSGCVEQVDDMSAVGELQHGRGDGNAAFALHLHPV